MDEDDDIDPGEIARLFERELLELNNAESDGDEDDLDIRILDDLGKQLKYSLHSQDEAALGEGDEWAALMESSKRASDRLEEIDLMTTSTILPYETKRLKQHWGAIEDLRLQEASINTRLNNLSSITTPRTLPEEHVETSSIIRELMDSMLDSVEYTWKIVISKEPGVANKIIIDFSSLPQIIADDIDQDDANMDAYKAGLYNYNDHVSNASEQLERERLLESFNFMNEAEAEAILLKEAEEAARILQEDKQQRLARKLRMMEEIIRAKQSKAATRIQSRYRGNIARTGVAHIRHEVREQALLAAEQLRIQIELEEKKERIQQEINRRRREFAAERREMEQMRDADIYTMQVNNWEQLCREREAQQEEKEAQLAFAEREAERLFAEEKYKNGRILEVMDERTELSASAARALAESVKLADENSPENLCNSVAAAAAVSKAIADEEMENDILAAEMLEAPWTRFGDAEEDAILKLQTPRQAEAKSAPSSCSKHVVSQKARNGSDDEDDDDDDDDDDESSRGRARSPIAAAGAISQPPLIALPALELLATEGELYPESIIQSSLRDMYSRRAADDNVSEFWHSLAVEALAAGAAEIAFGEEGVERAIDILQSEANILRIDVAQPHPTSRSTEGDTVPHWAQPPLPSPRAKVGGIKLVASRVSPRPSQASQDHDVFLRKKEFDKENSIIRSKRAEDAIARKALYRYILTDEQPVSIADTRSSQLALNETRLDGCPLLAALCSWQRFCADELSVVMSASDRPSHQRDGDMHGFDSSAPRRIPPPNEKADDGIIMQLGLRRDPAQVKSLELNVEGLHSCSFLRNYTSIRRLELNVNRLCSLDGLSYMTHLEDLSVKDNALTDVSALRHSTALRSLSLDSNRLSDLSDIRKLSNLVCLSASTNNLSSVPSLSGRSLQRLELYQNHISEVPTDSLRQLTSLTHLDLGRNKIEYIDGTALSHCVLLQTLVLSQNKLVEVPSPLYLPYLRTLWLSGNKLDSLAPWLPTTPDIDDGIWSEFKFSSHVGEHDNSPRGSPSPTTTIWPVFLPMLEKLLLQDNALQRVESSTMLCFPSLTSLDLSFNNIVEISDLEGVLECPKLRSLQIQENPVSTSTAGTDALYKWLLSACHNLKTISGDEVSDSEKLSGMLKVSVAQAERARLIRSLVAGNGRRDGFSSPSDCEYAQHLMRLKTPGKHDHADLSTGVPTNSAAALQSKLLHLVSMLLVEQNVFDSKQKLDRKNAHNGSSQSDQRSWDTALIEMLQRHSKLLAGWPDDSKSTKQANSLIVSYRGHGSESRMSLNNGRYQGKNDFQVRKIAATVIQALARGRHARANVRKALSAVQYKDEEIDEIDAMIKSMDFGVSDLDLEYLNMKPETPHGTWGAKTATSSTVATATVSKLAAASENPMVYGDHRRSKRGNSAGIAEATKIATFLQSPRESVGAKIDDDGEIPAHLSSWMSDNVAQIRQALTGEGATTLRSAPLQPSAPHSPRPSSAMSESSSITDGSIPYSDMAGSRGSPYRETNSGRLRIAAAQRANASSSSMQAQMAQEWGISDPKVMALMMKRNNRLQGLPANKGLDATSTLGNRKPMTVVSGSFGGAKKTVKSTKRGSHGAPPAWALGPQHDG